MSTSTAPIVIDLGKVKSKHIRRLKRGRGKLTDDVNEVVDQVRSQLGGEAHEKLFVPVVLVYRKKNKKKYRNSGLFLPF